MQDNSKYNIILQPGQDGEGLGYNPLKPSPYPFAVTERGKVLPGPHTNYEDWFLVGFQEGDKQRVVLFRDDFQKDPSRAIGLSPVFTSNGNMFTISLPIVYVDDRRANEDTERENHG